MDRKATIASLGDVKPIVKNGSIKPSKIQMRYLQCGLDQPGGKLPLFNRQGQRFKNQTVQSCIERGWAEPWFNNPIKPDWLVCKLTDTGRKMASSCSSTSSL